MLAEIGLETGLQPRSKAWSVDRHKARTGWPGLSRGRGSPVGLTGTPEAYWGHQNPGSWSRIGAQDLWQLLLQDGES